MAARPSDDHDGNPYAPPVSTNAPDPDVIGEVAAYATIRRAHLHHEATVRAIGVWFYIFALWIAGPTVATAALSVAGLLWPVASQRLLAIPIRPAVMGISVASGFALTWLCFGLARGLRQLRNGARWGCTVFLMMYLFCCYMGAADSWRDNAPTGSLGFGLCAVALTFLLTLLLLPSTRAVFTSAYREAVTNTPTLKARLHTAGGVTLGVAASLFILGGAIIVIAAAR
jgi:hypothetical protein